MCANYVQKTFQKSDENVVDSREYKGKSPYIIRQCTAIWKSPTIIITTSDHNYQHNFLSAMNTLVITMKPDLDCEESQTLSP